VIAESFSRMLSKSLCSPARPWGAETRLSPCIVLASFGPSTYRRGYASDPSIALALLDGLVEHPTTT